MSKEDNQVEYQIVEGNKVDISTPESRIKNLKKFEEIVSTYQGPNNMSKEYLLYTLKPLAISQRKALKILARTLEHEDRKKFMEVSRLRAEIAKEKIQLAQENPE